jgi:hypothetical protein
MSNLYGNPWTGLQVTVIGGEVALWTHVWPEFEAIWPNNPLQTVASPGTATPTTLISNISRFIGWAMFNATPTTRTEWQAGPLQSDALGNLKETLGTTIAGEDIPNDVTKVEFRNNGTYISTATTTVVKTGAGLLHTIVVQGGTTGTIIGYDNTAASGTILFSFDTTVALATYTFDVSFAVGLTVVTSAATKLTVSAR